MMNLSAILQGQDSGYKREKFLPCWQKTSLLKYIRQLDDGATKLLPLINLSGYFQTNLFWGIEIVDRLLYSQRGEA